MVNKIIEKIQEEIYEIRERADKVVAEYKETPIYTIENSKGTIKNYKYFIYPYKNFTETDIENEVFIAKYMSLMIPKDIDYLVTFESDGIGIGKLVSYFIKKPLIVCKGFHYNQMVIKFKQETGYFKRDMYCPSLIKGKKIAIVDCMVSTGGTIKGLLKELKDIETKVVGIFVVVNKTNYHKEENPFGELYYRYLFNLEIVGDKVETSVSDFFREVFWEDVNLKLISLAHEISKKSDKKRNDLEVGAILLDSDTFEILGWAKKSKFNHAEANAIHMAKRKHKLSGRTLTLYTTLEPCVKRTLESKPSCTNIILNEESIKWIVIREKDNFDKNNFNKGIKILSESGKYIVLLEKHPSRPINYNKTLTKRKHFSDIPNK